jgi:phage shock protein E
MIRKIKNILGIGPKIEFAELLKNGAVVLDVRSHGEFVGGHIKNSVNIPLDQLSNGTKKIKDKNKVILTCCASGMRSGVAKGVLKSAGFNNVHNAGAWTSLRKYEEYVRKP